MSVLEKLQPWIRPALVTASMGYILLGGYIAFGLEQLRRGLGHQFIEIQGQWLSAIPGEVVTGLFGLLLAWIGAREAGKWAEKKYSPVSPRKSGPSSNRPMPRPSFGQDTGEVSDDEAR